MADDLTQLREQFPDWRFGTVWATANSGPDIRRLSASRDGLLLTAWDRFELAERSAARTRSQFRLHLTGRCSVRAWAPEARWFRREEARDEDGQGDGLSGE